jgi:hypothetical protein
MAIVDNNDLTRGLRGRVGKFFVFRSLRGKTIVSHAPQKPDPRRQTVAQRQTRTTFREAAAWAVHILRDPKKKRFYQDRAKELALPNAYTAAVRAYMRKAIETEEQKSAPTNLHVCKPIFVSICKGEILPVKYQPGRTERRPPERREIWMPPTVIHSRGSETHRPSADILRPTDWLVDIIRERQRTWCSDGKVDLS